MCHSSHCSPPGRKRCNTNLAMRTVSDAENKPKETVEGFIPVVRGASEKVAPLLRREACNNSFRKGMRQRGRSGLRRQV